MRLLLILASLLSLAQLARIRRQASTVVPVVCSACDKRAMESPNMACCRCQDQAAFCNNDLAEPRQERGTGAQLPIEEFPVRGGLGEGLTCPNDIECRLFEDCTESACTVGGKTVREAVTLRQNCPTGQSLCCNPVPGDVLQTRLGLLTGIDPLGDNNDGGGELPICQQQQLRAVINFNFGLACGKRDSRVYSQARRSVSEGGEGEVTNPGEWPWAVLIFSGNTYVGSGVLMDNDVVVTLATKVDSYKDSPGALTVRLGDFDPSSQGPNSIEDFPHVVMQVVCVKIHPQFNYPASLEYNVAILKLVLQSTPQPGPKNLPIIAVSAVVDLRSAPRRPANRPRGVGGSSRNSEKEGISLRQAGAGAGGEQEEFALRLGLLADLNNEVDSLGEPIGGAVDDFIPRSYINTVCLPRARQFQPGTRCWVAAWGKGLREQREVNIPLVSKTECQRRLRPEFVRRNVTQQWNLSPSEICAGGELGIDACQGEGGAPLVCLSEGDDQFYAVGLVNYGFGCGGNIPAVYTNLADPSVKQFIETSFSANFC